MKPSEAPGKNSVAVAVDGLRKRNDTASQGVAEPRRGDRLLKTPNNPAMLDPMSPNKSPWIKGKEATTVRDDFGPKKKVNV